MDDIRGDAPLALAQQGDEDADGFTKSARVLAQASEQGTLPLIQIRVCKRVVAGTKHTMAAVPRARWSAIETPTLASIYAKLESDFWPGTEVTYRVFLDAADGTYLASFGARYEHDLTQQQLFAARQAGLIEKRGQPSQAPLPQQQQPYQQSYQQPYQQQEHGAIDARFARLERLIESALGSKSHPADEQSFERLAAAAARGSADAITDKTTSVARDQMQAMKGIIDSLQAQVTGTASAQITFLQEQIAKLQQQVAERALAPAPPPPAPAPQLTGVLDAKLHELEMRARESELAAVQARAEAERIKEASLLEQARIREASRAEAEKIALESKLEAARLENERRVRELEMKIELLTKAPPAALPAAPVAPAAPPSPPSPPPAPVPEPKTGLELALTGLSQLAQMQDKINATKQTIATTFGLEVPEERAQNPHTETIEVGPGIKPVVIQELGGGFKGIVRNGELITDLSETWHVNLDALLGLFDSVKKRVDTVREAPRKELEEEVALKERVAKLKAQESDAKAREAEAKAKQLEAEARAAEARTRELEAEKARMHTLAQLQQMSLAQSSSPAQTPAPAPAPVPAPAQAPAPAPPPAQAQAPVQAQLPAHAPPQGRPAPSRTPAPAPSPPPPRSPFDLPKPAIKYQ